MNEERENITNSPEEDWAMSAPPVDTVKTEPPPAQKDGWKMPEPVFRVSGGTVMGDSENKPPPSNAPPSAPPQVSQPPSQNAQAEKASIDTNIQPQPYISEEFNISQVKTPTKAPAKSKSKIPRILLIVLGLLAMAGFAVGFIILIYYLFFYQPEI